VTDLLEPATHAALDARVHGGHRLAEADGAALLSLRATIEQLADVLAASPVPPTLEHNDPHPGNVFARTGALFDWGDCVVVHPFVGLASGLAVAGRDLGAGAGPVGAAYLARFADLADAARLRSDAAAAAVLAQLVRAGTWLRLVPEARRAYPEVLPDRLRALLGALSRA
jgi:hypothetical protein